MMDFGHKTKKITFLIVTFKVKVTVTSFLYVTLCTNLTHMTASVV